MSVDLAENFLKCYSKCLLMCFSTCILGKIHKVGFWGFSGGKIALFWAILSHFFPFFEIFCPFLFIFLCWNHVIFGLQLVKSILLHICWVLAWSNSKSVSVRGYQGVQKHHFELFWHIFRCFFFFFSFPHRNYVIFGLQLV